MFKKLGLAVLVVCILSSMFVFSQDSFARGRHGGIQVIGPSHEAPAPVTENPCAPGRVYRGSERSHPRNATSCIYVSWKEGTLFLQGVISDVNDVSLSILDGGLSIDILDADVEYQPFFHYKGGRRYTDIDDATAEFDIEAGQHAFIQATLVETNAGTILKASNVRVMDSASGFLDSDEGGIRGVLDSFDVENGLAVIAGIPILMDESTSIRTRLEEGDTIAPGDLAGAHVAFIDTDEDGFGDSFYAERISICKISIDADIVEIGN